MFSNIFFITINNIDQIKNRTNVYIDIRIASAHKANTCRISDG